MCKIPWQKHKYGIQQLDHLHPLWQIQLCITWCKYRLCSISWILAAGSLQGHPEILYWVQTCVENKLPSPLGQLSCLHQHLSELLWPEQNGTVNISIALHMYLTGTCSMLALQCCETLPPSLTLWRIQFSGKQRVAYGKMYLFKEKKNPQQIGSGNPVLDTWLASRYPYCLFLVLQACFYTSPSFLRADVVPLSVSVLADVLANNSLHD